MPKITINEIDYTKSGEINSSNVVVYLAGLNGDKGTLAAGVPTLFTSLEEFTSVVGAKPSNVGTTSSVEYDKAYVMAYELLNDGMQVIYEVPLASGKTTGVVSKSELVAALNDTTMWSKLKDRTKYQFRFISNAGYVTSNSTTSNCIANMIDVASSRGDCVALVDCGESYTSNVAQSIYNEVNGDSSVLASGSEFAAMFAPWCSMTTVCASKVNMPGSFAYLKAYTKTSKSTQPWFAVAGKDRGAIPDIIQTVYEFGDIESDILQKKSSAISINPIIKDPTYGYIIWGNRTLNKTTDGLTAKDFLNIRQGISSIKKTLYTASRKLTFEQNSNVLWLNFKSEITPLLDRMKNGQGIDDYKITKVATSEKATLKATIRIIPIEAVEYFDLTVELADSLSDVTE